MFTRTTVVFGLALVLGAGVARAQSGQTTLGGSVARTAHFTSLVATHDDLAVRFRRLAQAAINSHSTTIERQALGRFIQSDIVPRLKVESVALYTAFDSIVGGGYAVPATLFDLDAIAFLVKEVDRTATGDRAEFAARVYALSAALESYFTKTQLLVLPVLEERLNAAGVNAVLARLEGRNTP